MIVKFEFMMREQIVSKMLDRLACNVLDASALPANRVMMVTRLAGHVSGLAFFVRPHACLALGLHHVQRAVDRRERRLRAGRSEDVEDLGG